MCTRVSDVVVQLVSGIVMTRTRLPSCHRGPSLTSALGLLVLVY